jgi:cation transport regulator ChaB
MYYASIKHLPQTLQETLPAEAQAVYLNTYNQIWDQYATAGHDEGTRATFAHQMAWDAIKQQFTFVKGQENSRWYRKGEEPKRNQQVSNAKQKGFFARLGFR